MLQPHSGYSKLRFRDREEAGRELARSLESLAREPALHILGIARGGVPVAFQIAIAMSAPLDVMVVRKLGVQGHPELAMGAIASGGATVLNHDIIHELAISDVDIRATRWFESREIERQELALRGRRAPIDVRKKVVVLVDDGLATGASMCAAARAMRAQEPARLVAAVPVGAAAACRELAREVDELHCLRQPEPFIAVARWYDEFDQTSDAEVRALLFAAKHQQ